MSVEDVLKLFDNDDDGYIEWRDRDSNKDKFVLQSHKKNRRKPSPSSLGVTKVHTTICKHIGGAGGPVENWTGGRYDKIGGPSVASLDNWLNSLEGVNEGYELKHCSKCCPEFQNVEANEATFGKNGTTKLRAPVSASDLDSAINLSIQNMVRNVQSAVSASGKQSTNINKIKYLFHTEQQLFTIARRLIDEQEQKCALTGLILQFAYDPAMEASLDRIDSDGHYQDGNLQVVCRFVNSWKSDTPVEEFRRLLNIVKATAIASE
jgi:hypothetical protein